MGSPRRVYGTLLAGKNTRLSGYEVWGPVHTHPDSQQAVARRALRNASLPDHRHGAPGGPVFFCWLAPAALPPSLRHQRGFYTYDSTALALVMAQ